MKYIPALLASLAIPCVLAASQVASSAPIAAPDLVFAEQNGIAAVEAEHFFKQELTEKRAWYITTAATELGVKPDSDNRHVIGASHGAYVELLPDTRATHTEALINGENFSGDPGLLAVLSYKIHFSNPGRYYVWVRAYSTGSEDNGVHVGLNGSWPESGRRWQTVAKNSWSWKCAQRTEKVHNGVPMQLFLDIPSAGEHTIQFSLREDGFEMDKFVLSSDINYKPEGTGPTPEVKSGKPLPAIPVPANYKEGFTAPASNAHVLRAPNLKIAGSKYYLDQGRWLAINPKDAQTATISIPAPVSKASFNISLYAVGESDGSSTYEVLIGGKSIGTFICPLSAKTFEEDDKYVHTWPNIHIPEGATIEVRSTIASADGKEYSRARWSMLALTPTS